MNNDGFMNIINDLFSPTLFAIGLKRRKDSISGKLYESLFTGNGYGVSISFEPGEGLINVIVFSEKDGALSDIDDRQRTPRLSDLNRKYMPTVSHEELTENERFFSRITPRDNDEASLIKMAKELRLVLPKYVNPHHGNH